jgi:hypothetical protein
VHDCTGFEDRPLVLGARVCPVIVGVRTPMNVSSKVTGAVPTFARENSTRICYPTPTDASWALARSPDTWIPCSSAVELLGSP